MTLRNSRWSVGVGVSALAAVLSHSEPAAAQVVGGCCVDNQCVPSVEPFVCSAEFSGTPVGACLGDQNNDGADDACALPGAEGGPRLAFLVGDTNLNAGDQAALNHLRTLRFEGTELVPGGMRPFIELFDDDNFDSNEIDANFDLVITSSTVDSTLVGGAFRNRGIPHVFWEPQLNDPEHEGLAGCSGDSQSSRLPESLIPAEFFDIFLLDFGHPITQGLTTDADGFLSVYDSAQIIGFAGVGPSARCPGATVGQLAPGAQVLAEYELEGEGTVVVAEAGGRRIDNESIFRARRVYLWLFDETFDNLNETGLAIFDRSVAWALASPPPVVRMPPVRIADGADDTEEHLDDNRIDAGSSDLELGEEGAGDFQIVGMRFVNVEVPQGAQIVSASIQFTSDDDDTDSRGTNLQVSGELAADAAPLGTGAGDLSNRALTEAFVNWDNVPAWNDFNVAGPDQQTPDLASIIAEITGQAGWVSGNALVIFVEGDGERTAESASGDAASAPVLEVTYIPPEVDGESECPPGLPPERIGVEGNPVFPVAFDVPLSVIGTTAEGDCPQDLTTHPLTTYTSSNERLAVVSSTGVVTAIRPGSVTIFVAHGELAPVAFPGDIPPPPERDDYWTTWRSEEEEEEGTYQSFSADQVALLAETNFFGDGSTILLEDGAEVLRIEFAGFPLDPSASDADTNVRRYGDPVRPEDPIGTSRTVEIEIVALSLVSLHPVIVMNGDRQTEQWDVTVDLSDSPQPLVAAGAPRLVRIKGGQQARFGAPLDTWISPLDAAVPFNRFTFLANEPVDIVDRRVDWTGETADTPVPAIFDRGFGQYDVSLNSALARRNWAMITLNVVGRLSGLPAQFTMWVAHLPDDINQDAIVNIRDATAFGEEFNSRRDDPMILDLNGDGVVNVRDATAFGIIWGRWRGLDLPTKPARRLRGELTATKTGPNGGTFTSRLPVQPRFTFVRRSDGLTRVLDTGRMFMPPIEFTGSSSFVNNLDPSTGVIRDPTATFVPGVTQNADGDQEPELIEEEDRFLALHKGCPPSCIVDLDIDSDNNNGIDLPDRSAIEDGIEENSPGKIICRNDDDDNNNNRVDMDEDPVAGENDLVPIVMDTTCKPKNPNTARWSLSWPLITPPRIQIWQTANKTGRVQNGVRNPWPPPTTPYWVEGVEPGEVDIKFEVFGTEKDGSDTVKANVVQLRFLNNRNQLLTPLTQNLNVSNFLTTAGLPNNSAFGAVVADPDNFRLEVTDASQGGPSVRVELQVIPPAFIGPIQPVIYTLDKKQGNTFRGEFLRLVSDLVDDRASGGNANADPGNQTVLAHPGDTIRLRYVPAPGAECVKEILVCRPANENGPDAIRRVNLAIRIAYVDADGDGAHDPGEEVVPPANVQAEIRAANERWAQACIRFSAPGQANFVFFPLPAGSTNLLGQLRTSDPNNFAGLGAGARAVLAVSPPAGGRTATIYFVPPLDTAIAEAYPPQRLKVATDVENVAGRAPGAGQSQANSNTVFIGTISGDRFDLAHEMGHILLNTNESAQPATVLFPQGTPQANNNVNAAKRLSTSQQGSMPTNNRHAHITGITAAGAVSQNINNLNVPATARQARAGLTGLGNTLLQR